MGTVVQVWLEEDTPERRAPFYLIETEFHDFATFLEFVDADRLICGSRLDSKWTDEPGVRSVQRRVPIAFRGSAMRRAALPIWRFVEAETA